MGMKSSIFLSSFWEQVKGMYRCKRTEIFQHMDCTVFPNISILLIHKFR